MWKYKILHMGPCQCNKTEINICLRCKAILVLILIPGMENLIIYSVQLLIDPKVSSQVLEIFWVICLELYPVDKRWRWAYLYLLIHRYYKNDKKYVYWTQTINDCTCIFCTECEIQYANVTSSSEFITFNIILNMHDSSICFN